MRLRFTEGIAEGIRRMSGVTGTHRASHVLFNVIRTARNLGRID
jgi:hypothetical protein